MQHTIDDASLLREMIEISNKYTYNRMHKINKFVKNVPVFDDENGERKMREQHAVNDFVETYFLDSKCENADLNQYWYSKRTIEVICNSILNILAPNKKKRVAFLSTPSLYFSIPLETRSHCFLFDIDQEWSNDPGFVLYDFNDPLKFENESKLIKTFDMVVIDPPFITKGTWKHYRDTALALLKHNPKTQPKNSLILLTTVNENLSLLQEFFGSAVQACTFKPSIPNLVYQYSLFANFITQELNEDNPEL